MTRIVLETTLKGKEKSLLDTAFPEGRLALVSDARTYEALGMRVASDMPSGRICEILLPGEPKPDLPTLAEILKKGSECVAYIAIGSGTINDLCKRAAYLEEKPYAVFPTAPSMNGYLSASASLLGGTTNGPAIKESVKAAPPAWLWADLEVLASAPLRLIQSGLGDSICRSTAQTDWLMSSLMLDTAYDPLPFSWLASQEEELLHSAGRLKSHDLKAVAVLFQTLILSGKGMTHAGGSYPASQGEHMIAHAYEMMAQQQDYHYTEPYHGELIAVTTLEMAALQESLLQFEKPCFSPLPYPESNVLSHKLGFSADACIKFLENKFYRIESRRPSMESRWEKFRGQVGDITRSHQFLHHVLEEAGMATSSMELGLLTEAYDTARKLAYATRDRFTFLDLEQMMRHQA